MILQFIPSVMRQLQNIFNVLIDNCGISAGNLLIKKNQLIELIGKSQDDIVQHDWKLNADSCNDKPQEELNELKMSLIAGLDRIRNEGNGEELYEEVRSTINELFEEIHEALEEEEGNSNNNSQAGGRRSCSQKRKRTYRKKQGKQKGKGKGIDAVIVAAHILANKRFKGNVPLR